MKDFNKNVRFENVDQIINMGGPWVGELFIEEKKIADNVIANNVLFDNEKIYFIKYHETSKWQVNNYFSICYFDTMSNNYHISSGKFSKIFLQKIESDILFYHDAFHDKDEKNTKTLNLKEIF